MTKTVYCCPECLDLDPKSWEKDGGYIKCSTCSRKWGQRKTNLDLATKLRDAYESACITVSQMTMANPDYLEHDLASIISKLCGEVNRLRCENTQLIWDLTATQDEDKAQIQKFRTTFRLIFGQCENAVKYGRVSHTNLEEE